MLKTNHQPLNLEITVLSAEGLKLNTSSPFASRLRPFITLSTDPPNSHMSINCDGGSHVFRTRVDETGASNPTWGDKLNLPIDTTFFSQKYASIYLQIFSKRLLMSKTQLGWCQIPATDIIEGFRPAGSVRHLSYHVRDRDGSRGSGIVNVAVRLLSPEFGSGSICSDKPSSYDPTYFPASDMRQMAIGIPVTLFPSPRDYCFMFDNSHRLSYESQKEEYR